MNVSHPSVHPVDVTPLPAVDGRLILPARVRMKVIQGMPGTIGGLSLRFCQLAYAIVSLVVMATTSDFPSVTAFWIQSSIWVYDELIIKNFVGGLSGSSLSTLSYLVVAVGLQSLWSLSLAFVDIHALLVGRTLQNHRVVTLFSIGDGVTSTLTFAAACASAGITVLIGNDLGMCSQNHCKQFQTATAMAFLCWFTALPSFLLNFWSLSSR